MSKKQTVWVHSLVYNEENFIWFAIMSVVDFVDKVLIWDTGSTDNTVKIIEEIIKLKGSKIEFKEVGRVDKETLPKMRQKMIEESNCDWIMLVDGDEIWPKIQIEKLLSSIENCVSNIIAVINKTRNCIGDVFHYLPESAGQYQIKGVKGNLNIRLIRKSTDLKVSGVYPLESFVTKDGPIEKQDKNLEFSDSWYLHASFLNRSSERGKVSGSLGRKKIMENGIKIDQGELPEVIFSNKPKIVNDLQRRNFLYGLIAMIIYPLIFIKRKVL